MKDLEMTSDRRNRTVIIKWTTPLLDPQVQVEQFKAMISGNNPVVEHISCKVSKRRALIMVTIAKVASRDDWDEAREYVKRAARAAFKGK